jgi:glycosyltransferase involved in cell wall biosynthesis
VLLDLSGNEKSAADWAAARLTDTNIRLLNKVDLKWSSKREALARVRALNADVFCLFTSDLRLQSGRGAIMLFAIFAGAGRVVMGDARGGEASRSRLGVLLFEAPRFALELLAGFGLLVPLSWLLTEVLGLSLRLRSPIRASRITKRVLETGPEHSLRALYVRATLTNVVEGGMSTHVAGFAGGAAALGHRLTFLVSGVKRSDVNTLAIEPSSLFSATKALFELWNNLAFSVQALMLKSARNEEIDFIYQRYSRFNWTGVLLSIVTGLPFALEYNGSEVWISRQWDRTGLLWLLKRVEALNLRAADLIFVVSDVERRNLIKAGVSAAKVIVNPNGVDTDRFRPDCGGAEIRRLLGIEDQVVVGFVGTFGPWHGAPVLADAATRINNSGSRLHFIFIGAGEQRAQTRSIIDSAGVSATFTGSIAHDKVPSYLDACEVLASPHVSMTDGSEFFGSPTKLFEYLAMRKGIIASRLGQVGEVISDGENGLLVTPGDAEGLARAIEKLAIDVELRERLGAAARETAISSYTWRHNAARVFDAIRRTSPG